MHAIPLCCFYSETPFVLLPYERTQCTRLPWLTASTADITSARLPSRCQLTPRKKAFSDEEFMKECLLDSVALICPEKKGPFENKPLSQHSNEAGWGHCGKLGASAEEQSGRLGLFFLLFGWELQCTWHCPATHLLMWDNCRLSNHEETGSHAVNQRDNHLK